MASKRAIRRRMCGAKNRYRTKGRARRAIKLLRRDRKIVYDTLEPYRCKFCRGFYFGHAPGTAQFLRLTPEAFASFRAWGRGTSALRAAVGMRRVQFGPR